MRCAEVTVKKMYVHSCEDSGGSEKLRVGELGGDDSRMSNGRGFGFCRLVKLSF